ncbi:MAG: type I glyceraldehyde-3-phosphate dehydrogenase [Firmicutes bacterium]|nr:type I glyceraldehyde-3-phosphate dehydrogenase [Bacillota bacterium]
MLKVGINGFGRIGRLSLRAGWGRKDYEVVAINDLTDTATLAHLLKYDSSYGIWDREVSVHGDCLVIGEEEIKVSSERDPRDLPWSELGVDVVIEATGRFRSREAASAHLQAGAKKVIITAPGDDIDLTIVLGVNENDYRHDEHHIVSNASCTTNALAPVVKVLHDNFGIRKGLMNTTHAYTNDQVLLDFPNKDLRRARSAPLSIIPTSTGAAKAVGLVMPELDGLLNGFALRVPTATVPVVDFVVELDREVTAEEINDAFMKASGRTMALAYSDEPLVSVDFKGNPYSSTVDGLSTMVVGGNLVRVVTWYDNEWAYSCRIGDLVAYMGQFF